MTKYLSVWLANLNRGAIEISRNMQTSIKQPDVLFVFLSIKGALWFLGEHYSLNLLETI